MSAISSAATQQKFTALRKRLDQLGYRQPLGIESLPLVERLFADLVHTTDRWEKVFGSFGLSTVQSCFVCC